MEEVAGCVGEIVSVAEMESKNRVGVLIPSKNIIDAFPLNCLELLSDKVPTETEYFENSSAYSDHEGGIRRPADPYYHSTSHQSHAFISPRLKPLTRGSNEWHISESRSPQKLEIPFTYSSNERQYATITEGLPPRSKSPRTSTLRTSSSRYSWLRAKLPNNSSTQASFDGALSPRQEDSPAKSNISFDNIYDSPVPPKPPSASARKKFGKHNKRSLPQKSKQQAFASAEASSSHHFDGSFLFSNEESQRVPSPRSQGNTESQRVPSSNNPGKESQATSKKRPKSANSLVDRLRAFHRSPQKVSGAEKNSPSEDLRRMTLEALDEDDNDIVPVVATKKELLRLEHDFGKREKLILKNIKGLGVDTGNIDF